MPFSINKRSSIVIIVIIFIASINFARLPLLLFLTYVSFLIVYCIVVWFYEPNNESGHR